MTTTTNITQEIEETANVLRSAAAWLSLAADDLEEGNAKAATNGARLGLYGAQGAIERLAAQQQPI